MAKSVNEVLEEIKVTKDGSTKPFSKKNFNKLLLAIVNDTDFVSEVAVVKNKELVEVQKIAVTKEFRKFLKKVLEKGGIDKKESDFVMDSSFEIPSVEGLYELFAAAMYTFMDSGNKFELLPQEDFKGSIYIKKNKEKTQRKRVRNPQTGEDLGEYDYTSAKHKTLAVSGGCPEYLKTRKRVNE